MASQLYPTRNLLKATTPEFRARLVEVANWLGVDPTDLAAIMDFESGFNPRAVNHSSQATGLIQWMPATAANLYSLTVAQIASLSAVDQLELVRKYFAGIRGRGLDAHQLYMLVWNGSPAAPDTVLGVSDAGGHSGKVYAQNKGLDLNHDGKITAGEASAIVRSIAAAARKQPPVDLTTDLSADPKAPPPATTATASPSQSGQPSSRSYSVRAGDTPWALAARYAGDGAKWRDLLDCNPRSKIERLITGAVIQLPTTWANT